MSERVFFGNLDFSVTADELRAAIAEHGEPQEVSIAMDRETGRPRGFAFVTMTSSAQAADVIRKMNGTMMNGRALRVDQAESKPRSGGGGGGGRDAGRSGNRGGGGGRW